MPGLFDPITVGDLHLRNRIMRSATWESLADVETGAPLPELKELYRALGEGGVGLIVTGHTWIEPSGRAHARMCSLAEDELIPIWREVIRPAQEAGARVMVQINHGGANVDPTVTPNPVSPSGIATNDLVTPRALADDEILHIVEAFGQAARRAREAGFDGVQIHGGHAFLVTQFLSPMTNRRDDRWGGDAERRRSFLKAIVGEMRRQVGQDYPLWIKLGVAGKGESGLSIKDGAQVAAACGEYAVECIEVSHGLGIPESMDTRGEGRYLPLAQQVRRAVGPDYPLALVYGLRSRRVMEEVLDSGVVQIISLCRPLIAEPDLPNKLREGIVDQAACDRCDRCGPLEPGEGIACRNERVLESLR